MNRTGMVFRVDSKQQLETEGQKYEVHFAGRAGEINLKLNQIAAGFFELDRQYEIVLRPLEKSVA